MNSFHSWEYIFKTKDTFHLLELEQSNWYGARGETVQLQKLKLGTELLSKTLTQRRTGINHMVKKKQKAGDIHQQKAGNIHQQSCSGNVPWLPLQWIWHRLQWADSVLGNRVGRQSTQQRDASQKNRSNCRNGRNRKKNRRKVRMKARMNTQTFRKSAGVSVGSQRERTWRSFSQNEHDLLIQDSSKK